MRGTSHRCAKHIIPSGRRLIIPMVNYFYIFGHAGGEAFQGMAQMQGNFILALGFVLSKILTRAGLKGADGDNNNSSSIYTACHLFYCLSQHTRGIAKEKQEGAITPGNQL